ncbi:myb-like protein AA [Drosophila erecta]|uniref:Uncharacterized protein n=1 Tax=Drosophila erecta TaxID=7220 RepID=B3NHM4_DROER|nr:myb-like protein AA [Drosophila erecta]EDV51819.2 uncharacterized protein Dere_GG13685 [Drosophila erecta]
MQLKAPKSRNMASLKDEEQAATTSNSTHSLNNNNNTNNINNNHSSSSSSNNNNNKNDDDPKVRKENLEARKQALEQRLSEKSWLLQQIQKQETAIINGNYEHMTVNEFFVQLAQQYKHEQQLQALARENSSILRRKQSTTSRESRESQMTNNNNNRQSETLSNRSSEYDNYQPSSSAGAGDMLVIGVAQQQAHQQPPLVKSALKKRPTPTPSQMQYMRQQHQQQAHLAMNMNYQRSQPDVISMYSANSSNVATLRQPPQVAPQQQPIIVQCDKYYLSPTHQSYNEGGFIKSSQNIKKYVSPMASPSNISYEQQQQRNPLHHQRQLDAISLAPSYVSVDMDAAQHQQQYRWRSQSHIAPLTPPQLGIIEVKSHSSDMLAVPMPPSRYPPHDEISLSSSSTTIEKKPKPKQWLESSLDGPAVIRQMDSQPHSPAGSSNGSSNPGAAAMVSSKPRAKLSSQSMSVAGRHYSMSNQRPTPNYPSASYAVNTSSKALLSQSTSYLNAMEQTLGISVSYPLEPLDIPALRNLPPKPSQMQQPTPPPRPPPANQAHTQNQNLSHSGSGNNSGLGHGNAVQTALVSPPLTVATASLSPEIRIESPKNMTVVQQATFQPYKEVTKPFEMSDFYKYSTKFKQKEGGNPN